MPSMRSVSFGTAPVGYASSMHALEAVFEYNGLVLNDRRQTDRYRLTAITGLDDPDVRDTREANPDFDGETAFAALYGGRTITLTGTIEAGNLEYLRYMQQNLKIAFDDISFEKDLLVRWYDWYDNFQAENLALWKQDYLSAVNPGTEGITYFPSGSIVPGTTQFQFLALARKYEDYQNTLKFHTGESTSGATVWVFAKWTDANNHIEARLTATTLGVYQYSPANVGTNPAPLVNYTLLVNTDYWLRLQQDGVFVRAQLFASDPDAAGAAPVAQTLVGTTENGQMGSGTVGLGGFGATIGTPAAWLFDSLDLRGANTGDVLISCKKIAKMEGTEGWNGFNFRLPFMITLRASSSLKLSRVGRSLPVFGRPSQLQVADRTFPSSGAGIPFDAEGAIIFGSAIGVAVNEGFAPTYPVVRLVGPLQAPAIVNNTNGTLLVISSNILAGEYIDIDCLEKTVRDQTGRSRYELLDITSDWLVLDPGDNRLFGASVTPASSVFTVVDTNWTPNPSGEDVKLGLAPLNWDLLGADTRNIAASSVSRYGNQSIAITKRGGTSSSNYVNGIATTITPVSPGDIISAGAEFRSLMAAGGNRSCRIEVRFLNAAGSTLATHLGTSVTDNPTGWTRATITTPAAPASTARAYVSLVYDCTSAVLSTGETHVVDGIIIVKGSTLPAYFDGDSVNCIWEGGPHASRSLKVTYTAIPPEGAPGSARVSWQHAFR